MTVTKYTTLLVRDGAKRYDITTASNPADSARVFCDMFHADSLPTESMWQLCLNSKLSVVGAFCIGQGGVTSCAVDVASIARNALLCGAYAVTLAHNHPSGNTAPSREDIATTRQVKQALNLFNITLCDHVIIGQDGAYHSMRECGEIF